MATNPSDPVARVYAAALYEVARDRGIVGDVYAGLKAVMGAYQDKDFRDFFTSPRVPREVKQRGLSSALSGKVKPEVLNFLLVLVDKSREPLLDNIFNAFAVYRDQAENRAHAWVESGTDFSQAEKDELVRTLSAASGGKEIVLHFEHKPDLLGGARVRLGDLLVDTTLRTRLNHLARAIAESV
ncbi:MAG: ATP synthase F1 subunit delta [Planctomycetes bacterium]|jgi:F-type H+-transporting ATPase subunit delta|nr:ATP synthase F1 subunit delta [Planctomycetota bacterium]MCL4728844.1 ATP synthase F1 subunit delta [Planctomycetota bacterium]